MPPLIEIEAAQDRLFTAVFRGRSERYCLRRWSEFIRIRDGRRCVACHSTKSLSAHHIVRKSFFPQAQLQRGNGITLCHECHSDPHEVFNGRPDLNQPMDAQGGDNHDLIAHYFRILLEDANERGLLHSDFYFIHDRVLQTFKRLQGRRADSIIPGTPLQQAYLIWTHMPPAVLAALMKVNGIDPFPDDYIPLPGVTVFTPS